MKPTNTTHYIANAFSLQMISSELWEQGYTPRITPVSGEKWELQLDSTGAPTFDLYDCTFVRTYRLEGEVCACWLTSVVGHADTAAVLGVECNRTNLSLQPGDVLYVAQLMGGRLPEGATTLPDGYSFKFFRVELVKDND